jgi:hypothetical protein
MLIWQVGGLAWWLYKGHRRALSSLYQLLFSTKGGAGYAYRFCFYEIIWSVYLFLMLGSMYSLCPFAAYYQRYGVRPVFTMSRISLADGKRAG